MSPSQTFLRGLLASALFSVWVGVAPASAAHHARLSADLVDQLTAGSQSIDVIVHGDRATVDALARRYNIVIKKYLKSGAVVRVNAGQLAALADDETLDHLSADTRIHSTADVTAQTIGADQVWAGGDDIKPLSGAGVAVAVIDSGVDPRHAALRGHVAYTKDFIGGDGVDRYGHGTHVAGIIAGSSGLSADTSEYRGIAYGASIVNLRVLDETGSGVVSDVVEAIDWAVEHSKTYGIRVINLSLGAPVMQPYRDDPLCEAVERAVSAGMVVVAAAGNNGSTKEGQRVYGSITSPGNDPSVITVGALDAHYTPQRSDDTVAKYSSRGPTMYDLVLKPDLVAPGSHVVSAEAADSYFAKTYSERHVAGSGPNAYIQLSGTSMAAGVVSGAVALMLEERPTLTPRIAKAVLQMTASFMPAEGLLTSGAGSANLLGAIIFAGASKPDGLPRTNISGELIFPSGLISIYGATRYDKRIGVAQPRHLQDSDRLPQTIIWGQLVVQAKTIIWGQSGDTIIWGQGGDTILWGQSGDTIIWGQGDDTIIWGQGDDTIIWGQGGSDPIIWGQESADTIIWGQNASAVAD